MPELRQTAASLGYAATLDAAWADHHASRETNAPTVISTFAGTGGSSLGYSMAGYRELLAVEWDDHAAACFRLNFPEVPLFHGDIAALSVDEALNRAGIQPGELSVFDGSPPCQGFSTAGRRALDDPRNQLFREYCRLLEGLKPRAFVMENVSGMVKGKMKLIFSDILRGLKSLGYQVSARLMNAAAYGVPQSRPRMIFIGIREDLNTKPSHPTPGGQIVTVAQAFRNLPDGPDVSDGPFTGDRAKLAMRIRPHADRDVDKKGSSYNLKRLDWNKPSRTILKSIGAPHKVYGGGLIHPDLNRHLTINELKRIGSFPDAFQLAGDYQEQWSRIGNSVPPLLMRAIARHIRTLI